MKAILVQSTGIACEVPLIPGREWLTLDTPSGRRYFWNVDVQAKRESDDSGSPVYIERPACEYVPHADDEDTDAAQKRLAQFYSRPEQGRGVAGHARFDIEDENPDIAREHEAAGTIPAPGSGSEADGGGVSATVRMVAEDVGELLRKWAASGRAARRSTRR